MSTITATLTASSEAVSEYKLILEKSLKDHEDIDSITEHFAEALQKPEVKEQAIKDIRNLTKTIKEIRAGFEHIAGTFVGFDSAKFLDKENNVLQLGGTWHGYFERFNVIVEESFKNATAAAAFMKMYSNALLTDVDQASFGDLQIELQAFVAKLEAKAQDALRTQNNFATLATDLRLFESVVEDAIRKAGARVGDDLTAARARLSTLQNQLAEVSSKMSSMGIACVSSLAVGAVSAGIAIFTLSPVAMFMAVSSVISAVGTGIKYAEAKKEASRLESEIQECNNQIAELMAKEELLNKYRQSLDATKRDIEGLAGKIDTIAGIWQYLKTDMLLLKEQLALSVDPDMPITRRFLKKIAATRELYVKLGTLLDMYAKGQVEEL
ncbi:hypothetical protein VTO73DRAFT_3673 [Trametes versicolor]